MQTPTASQSVLDATESHVRPEFLVAPSALPGLSGGMLPPLGSIVLYFGNRASRAWESVLQAARCSDWAALTRLDLGPDATDSASVPTPSSSFRVMCAGSTIADVAHLVSPTGTVTFPYTGGELAHSDFEVVETTEPGAAPLGYLLLARRPILSRIEQQLLELVRDDMRSLHVGPSVGARSEDAMDKVARVVQEAAQKELDRRQGRRPEFWPTTPEQSLGSIAELLAGDGSIRHSVSELLHFRRSMLGI